MTEKALKVSGKTIEISLVTGEVAETSTDQFWMKTGDGGETAVKVFPGAPVPREKHQVSVVSMGVRKTDVWYDCILVNHTSRTWYYITDFMNCFRQIFTTTRSNRLVYIPIILVGLLVILVGGPGAGLFFMVVLYFAYGLPMVFITRAYATNKAKRLQPKLERHAKSLLG